ncbi:MAG: cyclopropane-fatty-acyl-phospholipid synthase family protein [Gemmatimonadota bacterium]
MTDPLARLTPDRAGILPSARQALYQRLVLSTFSQMRAGCLVLDLPNGERCVMGTQGRDASAVIRVRNSAFFRKCVLFGDIGFGESYVDGDWETDSLARVIEWVIRNIENAPTLSGSKARRLSLNLLRLGNRVGHLLRANSLSTSRRNIAEHYDLGNSFYELWLDTTMTYSSGYFTEPGQSLEAAQSAKYDALCRKLKLAAGHHVLEIGTGWGGFASHAVRHYGCRVTTVTISEAQRRYAADRFVREGIDDRVEVRLADYRTLAGQYDRIVAIEMMEAIGDRYLETFCAKLHELLTPVGLVGVQYITVPDVRHAELARGVDWIQKHIFPGSLLLSVARVEQALNRTGDLFLHDLEDLGASYARTLQLWWERFNARVADVRALGFDERFVRKWNYYLQYCEAGFATRNVSVVQAIYTRPNNRTLTWDANANE